VARPNGSGLPSCAVYGPTVLPVFLVVFVMTAFIGVPVFLSWWRNRG
jgi:hypothetical protein